MTRLLYQRLSTVNSVKGKSMGYLKASKIYCVPHSTIFDKVHEKSEIGCRKIHNTVLSSRKEDILASWLIDMSKIGYGRSRKELIEMVQNIVRVDGRPNPFTNDPPGKDWFYGFMNRHPQSSIHNPLKRAKHLGPGLMILRTL